jgi:hypothetical protein
MHSMEIDRRTLIGALAGLPFAPLRALARADAGGAPLYASSCLVGDGRFAVVFAEETGRVVRTAALPARGHCAAVDPSGRWCVTFARRPGTFALAMDRAGGVPDVVFATPEGRHFEGHGAFSPQGALLYAAENAYDDGCAVVGVYDATDGFRRIGELPGHGLGTHELILAPDGRHLAIANGGILTHPDYPRAELNLDAMEPSLVLVDRETGDLLEKREPPADLRSLSLRHLAVDAAGRTWIGCQWNGDDSAAVPMVGVHAPGGEIELVTLPDDALAALDHYIGSVAIDRAGRRIAVTSPRGGIALIIDAETRRLVDRRPLGDGSGVAAAEPDGFVLTSGGGSVVVRGDSGETVHETSIAWDNHLRRL